MRILHLGFGFRPWIVNGLVIYVGDLMEQQTRAGHQVGYFFAGRQLPLLRRPVLHRWRRGEVRMYELMNSSLVVGRNLGTRDPGRDLDDRSSEIAFDRVLRRFGPDVVHVQDLGGLPSSLPLVAQAHQLPVVMTLHDYQALCPTIKLLDADGEICLRQQPGAMCVVCCADAPADNRLDRQRTLRFTRSRIRATVPGLNAALDRPAVERVADAGIRLTRRAVSLPPERLASRPMDAPATAYQRRRDVNVDRLNRLDALIAPSAGAAGMWRRLGIDSERLSVLAMNPRHIERLAPKRHLRPSTPVRFAVLNAASSTAKGADLIVATLAELRRRRVDGRFRLSVHGSVAAHVQAPLRAHPGVELEGEYRPEQLDDLLEDVDVGLMPSVWEEVYGFTGLEFLAKGIPVIGNDRGAIPDYVRPGRTGWLNRSASAPEMADLMVGAIEDPDEVQRLGRTAISLRNELVCPLERHLSELDAVYEAVRLQRDPATTESIGSP